MDNCRGEISPAPLFLSPSTDLCSPFDVRTCRCNNRTTPGAGPSKAAQKPKQNSKHPWSRPKRGGAGHPTSVAQIGVGGLCIIQAAFRPPPGLVRERCTSKLQPLPRYSGGCPLPHALNGRGARRQNEEWKRGGHLERTWGGGKTMVGAPTPATALI
jgi:hypothetical protein